MSGVVRAGGAPRFTSSLEGFDFVVVGGYCAGKGIKGGEFVAVEVPVGNDFPHGIGFVNSPADC